MVERYTNLHKIPDITAIKKNNLPNGQTLESPAPNSKNSPQESEIPSFYNPASEKKKMIGYMGFMSAEQQKRDQATLEQRNKKNQQTRKLTQTSTTKNPKKPSQANGKTEHTRIRPIAEQNESSQDSNESAPEDTQNKIPSQDNKNEISFDTDENGQTPYNPGHWNDEISKLEQYIKNVDFAVGTDSQEEDYTVDEFDRGQLEGAPAYAHRPSQNDAHENLFRNEDTNFDGQGFREGKNGSYESKKYESPTDDGGSDPRDTGRRSVDSPGHAGGSNGVKGSGRDKESKVKDSSVDFLHSRVKDSSADGMQREVPDSSLEGGESEGLGSPGVKVPSLGGGDSLECMRKKVDGGSVRGFEDFGDKDRLAVFGSEGNKPGMPAKKPGLPAKTGIKNPNKKNTGNKE